MCSVLYLASLCGRLSSESSHGCYVLRNSDMHSRKRVHLSTANLLGTHTPSVCQAAWWPDAAEASKTETADTSMK